MEEKTQVEQLLLRFEDVFSRDSTDLGRTDLIKHTIDNGDARPIKMAPRRLPFPRGR